MTINRYLTITIITCLAFLFSCKTKKETQTDKVWDYQQFRQQQQSFISSGGEIKYIDKGKGKTILLLHGVPSSSWLYRKMIDGLVSEGYRVIAPDMLGFGSSANPDGYDLYSAEEHGKRLLELMDKLKIEKWSHVMHDAGGLWTWELLGMAPERVEKLIALNTIIYEEGFRPPIRMKPGGFAKFSMWLYDNGMTTNMLLKQLFKKGVKKKKISDDAFEGYKTPMIEEKTKSMYYFFSQTCNEFPDHSAVISSINIPTAVIWGKHDDMLQWEPQKEKVIKNLNVNPKNVHLLDAKHFIQEEKPEEVNRYILDFLKQ